MTYSPPFLPLSYPCAIAKAEAVTDNPDNSPSCICPACGKSFARPDVLRKHLSTSCKLRRGSDGEAAPLTSAEEDAIIPRKRRRTKARAAVSPSPSSSSSSVSADERVRRVPASSSSASSASTKVATPVSPSSAVSPQSPGDDRMSAHYARLRSLASFQAAGGRLSSSLPTSSEGPTVARAGASLDTPLAPAFAATPETFGDLALGPLSSLPSFSLGLVSPKSTPATIAPSAVSASASVSVPNPPAQKEQPTWSTSANDDLLSWLFTVTNTVPPSAMAPSLSSSASSASSSGSVGSVDAWPVTPSEPGRKLSDAGELADLALLPDLPFDGSVGGGNNTAGGLGLGGLEGSADFNGLGGFSAIRGLPGMPEFGDKNGTDWLSHKSEKYDPYAYDQNTMAQMRVYYELYFKA